MCYALSRNSPLVEGLLAGVVLQAALVDQEFHPLEEGSGDGGRLLSQKYVDRFRSRHAELTAATEAVRATLWVRAIDETVCKARANTTITTCRLVIIFL